MKKVWSLLLLLVCMAALPASAEEVDAAWKYGSKAIDAALITDGSDETEYNIAKKTSVELTCTLPDGTSAQSLYLRMDSFATKVEWQQMNAKKKWETVASIEDPVAECVLVSETPLTGRMRLRLTYKTSTAPHLKELRLFAGTEVPADIHGWKPLQSSDVLLVLDDVTGLDLEQLRAWTAAGHSVSVAALQTPGTALETLDGLWDAGIRTRPDFAAYTKPGKTPEKTLTTWKEKNVIATVTTWLRKAQPLLAVDGGEVTALVMEEALKNAGTPLYATEEAAQVGLWAVPATMKMSEDVSAALNDLAQPDPQYLRNLCKTHFSQALTADPATIPYPDNRDAEGYLTEGEFVHVDAKNGLWAYLSPTVQVEVLRYEQDVKPQQVYFVADVKFKPESEQMKSNTYVNAKFKNQIIYPQTLAQANRLVIGVNGDYFIHRVNRKRPVGNIIRDGEILYTMDMDKSLAWPNLDTMVLHDDGSMSVYAVKEISAEEILAKGDVHDALSFGPYLIRDGKLRIFDGENHGAREPRTAIGMVEPGHYILLVCEGRVKNDASGMSVNETGMLFYGLGCEQAFMLDGGNTSVMVFMGEVLSRSGDDPAPRNQNELIGVGTSELVPTDWINGKPKK